MRQWLQTDRLSDCKTSLQLKSLKSRKSCAAPCSNRTFLMRKRKVLGIIIQTLLTWSWVASGSFSSLYKCKVPFWGFFEQSEIRNLFLVRKFRSTIMFDDILHLEVRAAFKATFWRISQIFFITWDFYDLFSQTAAKWKMGNIFWAKNSSWPRWGMIALDISWIIF